MKVDVHLPSGHGCSVEVSPETTINELKAAAQKHFQRRLKLTAKGRQLDLTATLSEAGLRDGDIVAAVVQIGKLAATFKAFAWHGHAGEVVTWGDPGFGGDSSQVQECKRSCETSSTFKQLPVVLLLPFLTVGMLSPGVIQTVAGTAARCKSS
ncbi:unnamed protein product [Effrenium voratum]|nr:unnamed protein product [Effrenium voratum]